MKFIDLSSSKRAAGAWQHANDVFVDKWRKRFQREGFQIANKRQPKHDQHQLDGLNYALGITFESYTNAGFYCCLSYVTHASSV